jgi:hypothetical protein
MKEYVPDEQVEAEIARLTKSPYVRMARMEHQIRYRRRKYLSELRGLEKRGMELEKLGFSTDNFEESYQEMFDTE